MWLANQEHLERCTLGSTPNQNGSFNVIWLRDSKTQLLGLPTVELAASTAVLDFNEGKEVGMKNLFAQLGVEFTARAQALVKVATGESDNWNQIRLYKT